MDSSKRKAKPATIAITISPAHWLPSGPDDNPRARLLTTMEINGQSFHVEAYQVRDKSGGQMVLDRSFDPEWQGICALQSDGGAFTTQRIGRREYVIVISPFLN